MYIKLPTASVIQSLENKIAQLAQDYKTYSEAEAVTREALAKWKKQALDTVLSNKEHIIVQHIDVYDEADTYCVTIEFEMVKGTVSLPPQPTNPVVDDLEFSDDTYYRYMVSDIQSILRQLRMTDEKYVSKALYQELEQYL